jgi:hypothetical protein
MRWSLALSRRRAYLLGRVSKALRVAPLNVCVGTNARSSSDLTILQLKRGRVGAHERTHRSRTWWTRRRRSRRGRRKRWRGWRFLRRRGGFRAGRRGCRGDGGGGGGSGGGGGYENATNVLCQQRCAQHTARVRRTDGGTQILFVSVYPSLARGRWCRDPRLSGHDENMAMPTRCWCTRWT